MSDREKRRWAVAVGTQWFINLTPPQQLLAGLTRYKIGKHFYFLEQKTAVFDDATNTLVIFFQAHTKLTVVKGGSPIVSDPEMEKAGLEDFVDSEAWYPVGPFANLEQ